MPPGTYNSEATPSGKPFRQEHHMSGVSHCIGKLQNLVILLFRSVVVYLANAHTAYTMLSLWIWMAVKVVSWYIERRNISGVGGESCVGLWFGLVIIDRISPVSTVLHNGIGEGLHCWSGPKRNRHYISVMMLT